VGVAAAVVVVVASAAVAAAAAVVDTAVAVAAAAAAVVDTAVAAVAVAVANAADAIATKPPVCFANLIEPLPRQGFFFAPRPRIITTDTRQLHIKVDYGIRHHRVPLPRNSRNGAFMSPVVKRISTQAAATAFTIAFSVASSLAPAADVPAKSPTAQSAQTTDWPQFGGVDRDGKSAETGLLKQWPAGGPPLAWKIKTIGAGMGGVSVSSGRVYTTGDLSDAAYVFALNESDGKQIWKTKIGPAGIVGQGSNSYAGPRATPTVANGRIYIEGHFGDVACLDASDGKPIWHISLADLGGSKPTWAFSESPLVDGDKVIVTPGGSKGTLAALNAADGKLIWQSKGWTDAAAYASPVVTTLAGVRQYVQITERSLTGVNPDNGDVLWKVGRNAKIVIPTLIIQDPYIYSTSGYGYGCDLYQVSAGGGKLSVKPVYTQNKVVKNHHGGVVLVDGKIYGHSDQVGWVCQDMLTGKDVWKEKEKLGKGSIAYADGHLYLRQEDGKGTIVLIEASPTGYKETGRFDQPDRSRLNSWPHPVIANGKLYIHDQETLLCYDVKAK
jgi:outer membrane protein assembly factor BamB